MTTSPQRDGDAEARAATPRIKLVRPGEGRSVVELVAAAEIPGLDVSGLGEGSPLQAALDRHGGRIRFAEVDGGTGWCFGAELHGRLAGVLYACSPVGFIRTFQPASHRVLSQTLVEIEILAVEEASRGAGVGTELLLRVESTFRALGLQLIVAKVHAEDKTVLRWYSSRGYTIADPGESCHIHTPEGVAGIDAGGADSPWRLAVKALGRRVVRGPSGLWLADRPPS